MFRGWCIIWLAVSFGCQCERTDVTQRQFACVTDSDCVTGYACSQRVCRLRDVETSSPDARGGFDDAAIDAGVSNEHDAGPADDAGTQEGPDGSTDASVGGTSDSGLMRDAGRGLDAGAERDAGVAPDAGAPRDAGPPDGGPLRAFCPNGYCWVSPLPHGNTLVGVAANSDSDVWTVAFNGHLSHWNGLRWDRFEQAPIPRTKGVWMSPSGTVYVVGNGFARLDGSNWRTISTPTLELSAVWGLDDGRVWMVGANGFIGFWNGNALATQASGTPEALHAIQGVGPQDIWAVGNQGTLLKFNGTSWSRQTSNTTNALWSVTATSSTQVFVGGDRTLLRWNSSMWSATALPSSDLSVVAGAWEGPTAVLFSGFTRKSFISSGTSVADDPTYTRDAILAATRCGTACIVGAGQEGRLLFRRNDVWSSPSEPQRYETIDVHGTGRNNVWTVGHEVGRFDGTTWSPMVPQPPGFFRLGGVHVFSSSAVFAVGGTTSGGLIFYWNGTSWATQEQLLPEPLRAVHGTSPTNVWAVGGSNGKGLVLRYDGIRWTTIAPLVASTVQAVAVRSNTEVWFGGDNGYLARWDGATLMPVNVPGLSPLALILDMEIEVNRVTAVGITPGNPNTCLILEKNGAAPWGILLSGPTFVCHAVSAVDGRRWVATSAGVSELVNNALTLPAPATTETVSSIYVGAADDIWVVGGGASIVHKTP
jgi:hypothetical protein